MSMTLHQKREPLQQNNRLVDGVTPRVESMVHLVATSPREEYPELPKKG